MKTLIFITPILTLITLFTLSHRWHSVDLPSSIPITPIPTEMPYTMEASNNPMITHASVGNLIARKATKYNIPLSIAMSLIKAESNFNQYALAHNPHLERKCLNRLSPKASKSPQGKLDCKMASSAIGLMQVLGTTGQYLCNIKHWSELYNADDNLECGFSILKRSLKRWQGNITLALYEYNGGLGAVKNPSSEHRKYASNILLLQKSAAVTKSVS